MKVFKLLFLVLAVSMVVISCEKDYDDAKVAGNKDETTYAKMIFTGSDGTETTEATTKAELEKEDMYSILEFKTDGNFILMMNKMELGHKADQP